MRLKPVSKLMSRAGFERLISGQWADRRDGRYRVNGSFSTWVKAGWKYVSDGTSTIKAKSWRELALILELIPND